MVEWPAGHRWEDYRIDIISNTQVVLGSLGTVHNLKGQSRLYGGYKAKMTFSLEKADPWASILNESKTHFCCVYRDGVRIWSGVQVKLNRTDEQKDDDEQADAGAGMIDFEFLPLAHIARWRYGMPVPPAIALTINGEKLDDAMKWVVERTLGATAPASPTSSIARAFANFVVAADKTEYPDTEQLVATFDNIYEVLERVGAAHQIDWDIFWNASGYPEFETWYPRRGLDRSEGNGARAEVIFTDKNGAFTSSEYSVDTADMVTIAYDALMSQDQAAVAGTQTDWLVRDLRVKSTDDLVIETALGEHDAKISVKLKDFVEQRNCQWDPGGTADIGFDLGDLITWRSIRMGYGPTDDIICGINWEIDEDGYEHLEILLGDPTPDILDKLRGGGQARWTWDDTGTGLPWGLEGDASTPVYADANNRVRVHSDTPGYAFTEDAANNELDFTGPWTRVDGGGGDYYLRQTGYGDDVRIQSAAVTDKIWLEGDTGKSHFADDMYIGGAAGVADSKLHIKDGGAGRFGARITFENGSAQKAQVGVSDDGEAFLGTSSAQGVSLQVNGTQKVYCFDDAAQVAFENGGLCAGYLGMSSTGGVPNEVKWSLSNANGNFFLHEDATTNIGGYLYTWPKTGAAQYDVLTVGSISGANITLDWAAPGVTAVGNGTAQWQVPVTGATPFAPAWTLLSAAPGAAQKPLMSDASGHLTLVRFALDASYYITKSGANILQVVAANTLDLYAGGVAYRFQGAGFFSAGVTCGASAARWSNVFSELGNFSGLATLGGNFAMAGNTAGYVPIADGTKFVAGAITKAMLPQHSHGISGDTADFSPAQNSQVVNSITFGAGTHLWLWTSTTGAAGGTEAWVQMYAKSGTHKHGVGTLVIGSVIV